MTNTNEFNKHIQL